MVSTAYFIYPPLTLLNVGIISYTALPAFENAHKVWQTKRKITNHAFTSLANILMLVTGNYFAVTIQNLIYYISEHLIEQSREKSISLATDAYQKMPKKVWISNNGVELQIPLAQVQNGDVVIVTTGEVIPIDGKISTGMALIDQQTLTGESNPIEKMVDDTVMASTIVLNGRIGIRASHSGEETRIYKLNQLLQKNENYKTQLQLKGEAWADKMVVPMIMASTAVAPFMGVNAALALLFSLPANTVRSMLSAQTVTQMELIAKQQIAIKDGRVLEELPRIDTILFDKTGTLTQTHPTVTAIIACDEYDADTLLAFAAAGEQRLDHPIAHAIVDKAVQQQLELPKVLHSHYDLGLGISIQTEQHEIKIGSQRFIEQATNTESLPSEIETAMQASLGHSFILIAVDGKIQGALELHPPLRPEVPALITALKQRGFKQLLIVSGDQYAPTKRLASRLGMDKVYSEVLPQDKAALIRQLQSQGRHVCFVGDGVNDAIAMKQANVSVCLQSASAITSDVAQIVLLNDNLAPLNNLFDMAEELHNSLRQGLYFWGGFSIANTISIPLLGFGAFQSSVFYLVAYTLGLRQAKGANKAS